MLKSRIVFGALTVLLLGSVSQSADTPKELEAKKTALQQLHEFIGDWKGDGQTKSGKNEEWKEEMRWGWRFKGDESWLSFAFTDGKAIGKGELRYDPAKKQYQMKITDGVGKDRVFEGEFKGKRLTLAYTDPTSTDKYILVMSTNNDGARFVYNYAVQTKGKGLEKPLYQIQHKKEGASLTSGKKNECVVSGGLGTMQVSYNGKTYYVCCSGCADAFRETPKKFVDEFEKKNKK